MSRYISFSLITFSNILPFLFVSLHPHRVLWLLKSPIRMKGLGNWSISFFNSFLSMSSLGGIYIEHIFTALYCVALIGNCFDVCYYTYFTVWYIVSDQNRYPSENPDSGIMGVIKHLIVPDINVVTMFQEGFLEADNWRTFLCY